MSLSSPSVIVGVVLIIVSVARGEILRSPCTSPFGLLSHPTDCTRYMECVWGQPLDRPCAPGTVFSFSTGVCVFPWDKTADVCLKTQDSVVVVCQKDPTVVLAHPANCHQYYNCSGHTSLTWFLVELGPDSQDYYLYECPYPQLFNEDTLRCEDYRDVQCGEKFLPLDPCDYTFNMCRGPHCIPCNIRAPSCRQFSDGINVFRSKLWSPYFVVCKDQRLVTTSSCIKNDKVQFFSPDLGRCIE